MSRLMMEIKDRSDLLKLDVSTLYDLRDYINCSNLYDSYTKQSLMDILTSAMRDKELIYLMKPLVKEFIRECGGSL